MEGGGQAILYWEKFCSEVESEFPLSFQRKCNELGQFGNPREHWELGVFLIWVTVQVKCSVLFLGCHQSESVVVYVLRALQNCLCMLHSSLLYTHPPNTVIVLLCYMVTVFRAGDKSIATHSSILFSVSWIESVSHFHFEKVRLGFL